MRIRLCFAVALSLAVAAALASSCFSQTTPNQIGPQNVTGIQAYDPYGGVRENINLGNGDLNLQIPLVSIPGRNGHDFSLTLHYDSKIWNPHSEYDSDTGLTFYYWGTDYQSTGVVGSFGWHFNVPILMATLIQPFTSNPNYYCYGRFILITADGSKHSFFAANPLAGVRTGCYLVTGQGNVPHPEVNIPTGGANDSAYLLLDTSNSTDIVVRAKDGMAIHFSGYQGANIASRIEDTNGNIITFSGIQSITDTVGRIVTISTGSPRTISYKDSTGTQRTITLTFATQTLTPTFQLPAGSSVSGSGNSLLTSITLPNNLSWSFQYNTFGELTKVTYPTGGYTRYDYTRYTNWVQSFPPNPPFAADFREVSAKYVCKLSTGSCSPGTNPEDVTTYTPTVDGTKTNNQYMDVVSPLGDRTRHQFSYLPSSAPYSNFYSMRETLRYHYQGQNTLLRTVQTDYNNLDANGNTQNISLPIRETTTLNDVSPTLISKTEWDYSGTTDNVSEERDYDFGSGAVGSLLRKKDYTWLAVNPVNSQDYTSNALHILNRKASEQIKDASGNVIAQTQFEYDNYAANGNISASGAVQHDSTFGITFTTRGNATTIKQWRNTDGAWLNTNNQYDDAGNALKITDPLGHATQFGYTDSWGNTTCTPTGGSGAAYVSTVTDALLHVRSTAYNSCTGTPSSATDVNSKTTTFTYDLMNRVLTKNLPDGGQTSMTYNDVLPVSFTSSTKITTTPSLLLLTTAMIVDGLGRPTQLQLTSDQQGTVYTDTTYDALGRKSTVSNPYRTFSDSTYGISTTNYDALGRITKVIPPDGTTSANNITTTYSGRCTTVTDQAGKSRTSCADALGRLIQAIEDPGTSPHLNFETDYAYDVLDNLLCVGQKGTNTGSFTTCAAVPASWRPRNFIYNSLSQLTQASNPESGTISYGYDAAGNLSSKTSPAPNQTGASTVTLSYCYDALNRKTSKAYTAQSCPMASPVASYFYDQTSYNGLTIANGIGRRTGMSDAAGAEAWSYDITAGVGWKTTDKRTTNGISKITIAQNNLAGSVASLTYPSTRVITYNYNGADWPTSAIDSTGPINYATNAAYAPTGALGFVQNGGSLYSTYVYNKRLQPCWSYVTNSSTGAPTLCTQTGVANAAILDFQYDFGLNVSDNGNVNGVYNRRDQTRSQLFSYDSLNRIYTAATQTVGVTIPNANCWGLTYGYDAWGNLLTSSITGPAGCSGPVPLNSTVDTSYHNRIATNTVAGVTTNYCFDSAGNLIHAVTAPTTCPTSGPFQYTYNAENQITTTASITYTYDGDGKRVEKSNGKLYWYGVGSDPLDETDLAGNTNNSSFFEYVFFAGKRLARRDSSSNVNYYFADHLGSARIVTNAGGTVLDNSDFYPFGTERPISSSSGNNYKFTGKERDSESGLDDFGARYYSSAMGRFTSPDWSAEPNPVPYANLNNPQTLNLYSYVQNNPLSTSDLDGHDPDVEFKSQAVEDMFSRIANESDSFRTELDDAKKDHNITVVVQEVGVQTLPDHAPGDAVATLNSDGTVTIVINVRRDDDRTAEHEVGHEQDARTNTKQFFDDAKKDAKAKGGPAEKSHDERPVEQRANKFRDQVERERKQHRQEEKERKRREKEERKKKREKKSS